MFEVRTDDGVLSLFSCPYRITNTDYNKADDDTTIEIELSLYFYGYNTRTWQMTATIDDIK